MADPLGMLASCLAVAGLALKVTKLLDDMIDRWNKAELNLVSLQTQVRVFGAALNELADWMRREYLTSNVSSTFANNLALSVEGCMRFLLALNHEVEIISSHGGSRMTAGDKAMLLWNDKRIKELKEHLSCQTEGLMLLLQCKQLSQQQNILVRTESQAIMSNVKNDVNELRQKEISSTTPRLRSPSPRSSWFRLKSKPALKAPQDQLVYEDYLTILAQSTENAEKVSDAQPGSPNVITTPHLPLVEQLRAEYNEIVSRELDVLVPERPKLRVLIIGQNGVGKTTLCNKMLGIPVSEGPNDHRGQRTPIGKIWEEITFEGLNERLVVHDSGGFQAGTGTEMAEIKKFISFRIGQDQLEDQLHCIWYCISCIGSRSFQEAENLFFNEVDTGQIPVFVVFTKYDELVQEHANRWEKRNKSTPLLLEQRLAIAETPAFSDYEVNFEGEIRKVTKNSSYIKTCRTAIQKGEDDIFRDVKLQKHRDDELTGLGDLTKAVADALDNKKLRQIWVAGQKSRVDLKLKDSLAGCISQYWKVQKVSKIPFIPLICLWTMADAYDSTLRRLSNIWGIRTTPPDILVEEKNNLSFGFLEAIYDLPSELIYTNSAFIATYTLGKLTGPTIAKITLKMIVGLTLLFERLFTLQQKRGERAEPLSRANIQQEAHEFRKTEARKRMAGSIEKGISSANCYVQVEAEAEAEKALRAANSIFAGTVVSRRKEFAVWDAMA